MEVVTLELTSEPDYIEQPVIDIEVEFAGGNAERDMIWTVNDTPDTALLMDAQMVSFHPTPNTRIVVQVANTNWISIRHRLDRIPVRPQTKNGSVPATSPSQPEGGMVGDEDRP